MNNGTKKPIKNPSKNSTRNVAVRNCESPAGKPAVTSAGENCESTMESFTQSMPQRAVEDSSESLVAGCMVRDAEGASHVSCDTSGTISAHICADKRDNMGNVPSGGMSHSPELSQFPLLPYSAPLLMGRLIKRVKRFSVCFSYEGQELWAHTNNSGSMMGLLKPGLPMLVSVSDNPARKMPYTLEMVNVLPCPDNADGSMGQPDPQGWVGVNTLAPNRLLVRAFHEGRLPFAQGYEHIKPEAKTGDSRMDALLTGKDKQALWVECKNVTLVEDGLAAFPDAVTERGQKHLRHMAELVKGGARAAFFYCIQRSDARCFAPADFVDERYARLFYETMKAGVEVYPYVVQVGEKGLDLAELLPVLPAD